MYFFYFYPVGIERKAQSRPVLSWILIALMLVGFLWMKYLAWPLGQDPWDLVFFPGQGGLWTVVTALFLHGGWVHLLGNLIYFQVFAPPLEDTLGPGRFLAVFLILGVAGNLTHGLVSVLGLLGQGGMGVLGSSGAIAGLLAFALVRFPQYRVNVAWWVLAPLGGQNRAGKSPVPVIVAAGLWFLLQVVQALLASETGASVSFGAHIGGFLSGLILAVGLGQWQEGRTEVRLVEGRRYFREGHFHAAVGSLTEYLDLQPEDCEARVELARALKFSGQLSGSNRVYREVLEDLLGQGAIPEALEVYLELSRGGDGRCLPPETLARVAYYHEKQLDHQGALDAYRQLYEAYPATAEGQRALVRVIVLYQGKVGDKVAAATWLARAHAELPPGSWRDFLEREFGPEISRAAALHEDPRETPSAQVR